MARSLMPESLAGLEFCNVTRASATRYGNRRTSDTEAWRPPGGIECVRPGSLDDTVVRATAQDRGNNPTDRLLFRRLPFCAQTVSKFASGCHPVSMGRRMSMFGSLERPSLSISLTATSHSLSGECEE